MRKTTVIVRREVKLNDPILIEGLPGLGLVGRMSVRYLVKQLNAELFAKLYSPHFPYYVIVDKAGGAKLPSCSFYAWKRRQGQGGDLILLTGDAQAQTIEGQYEVSDEIIEFARRCGVGTILTIGGYSIPSPRGGVFVVATHEELLNKLREANALPSKAGDPVVGTAGLIIGLAEVREGLKAACLLSETQGYMPDVKATRSVLEVLCKFLDLKIDLSGLDREAERLERFVRRLEVVEKRLEAYEEAFRMRERVKTTYIS